MDLENLAEDLACMANPRVVGRIREERDRLAAENEELRRERDDLGKMVSDLSTKLGEAQGQLEVSQWPVLEEWIKCKTAESDLAAERERVGRLREAITKHLASLRRAYHHKINGGTMRAEAVSAWISTLETALAQEEAHDA